MSEIEDRSPHSGPSLYGDAAGPAADRGQAPGLLDQLAGVFTDPVPLFQQLNRTPVWGMALVLLVLSGVLMAAVWGMKVDVDAMLRPALEANPRIAASQIDDIIAMQAKFILPMGVAGSLVGTPIAMAFFALIYWGLGIWQREGERPTYVHALSAVVVPSLLLCGKQLLITLMCFLKTVGGAKPDHLSPTSVGFFVHVQNPKLQALLTGLDLFSLAGYVLAYLAVRHTLKAKPLAGAIVVGIFVAFQALGIAFAR